MIITFLLLLFLSFGLGAFLPSLTAQPKADFGIRALGGFAGLTCLLYIGIVLLQIGLVATLYGALGLAAIGVVLFVRRLATGPERWQLLYHPLILLPLAIVAVTGLHGPVHFAAYGDDTFINWLAQAKQMWLVDDFHDDRFISAAIGYLPGWHFLLGFTSPLWGNFSETRAIAVPAALHIALLAAAFDVLILYLQPCRLGPLRTRLLAWSVLLLLVTAEASWQLVPTLVLSEMPLFYSLIGLFLVASLLFVEDTRAWSVVFCAALLMCLHYLIKTQGIAAVPVAAALVFGGLLFRAGPGKRPLLRAACGALLVVAPTLIVFFSWKLLGPEVRQCASNVTTLLGKGFVIFGPGSNWWTLAKDLIAETAAHIANYKWVVSLIALSGLFSALFDRRLRWLSLAVVAYIGIYMLAVYWSYLGCPDGFNSYLSSLPRYLQLPIRLLHFVGPTLLAAACLRIACAKYPDLARRLRSGPVVMLAGAAIAVMGLVQVRAIESSLATLSAPGMGIMEEYSYGIRRDAERLRQLTRAKRLMNARVLLVHSFHEHLPYIMGIYHGFYETRDQVQADKPLSPWQLAQLRYEPERDMQTNGRPELTPAYFQQYDVIWPVDRSPGLISDVLALTGDQTCAAAPEAYFLIREAVGGAAFSCVAKFAWDKEK